MAAMTLPDWRKQPIPTVVENAIMFTCRSSKDRLSRFRNVFKASAAKTYRSSVFREGDFSISVRWELYVPSSIALTGELLPSIRSYSVPLKLTLSVSGEREEGIVGSARALAFNTTPNILVGTSFQLAGILGIMLIRPDPSLVSFKHVWYSTCRVKNDSNWLHTAVRDRDLYAAVFVAWQSQIPSI